MSAAASAAAHRPPPRSRIATFAISRPLWPALAITVLLTALRLGGTVDSDVAWQLWIAGRIHSGAHLYRDIIEVNPPLWFWMALPVDRLASMLHVRPEPVLAAAVGLLAMLALPAIDRLINGFAPQRRLLLLAYTALILIGLPWVHVGQREQLVLLGTVPYAALIAARRESRQVPPLLALAVGAGAALGFALKHYFLIVPALLELWLVSGLAGAWRWRRPENVAIIAVGSLYAGAILIWAPDFLTSIVPLIRLSYGMLGAPSARYLFGPFAIIALVSLFLLAALARPLTRGESRFSSAMLIAAIGFVAVYFVQSKGWTYHVLPMLGCASLALAALALESGAPKRPLHLVAPALLLLPFYLTAKEQLDPMLSSADLNGAVSGLQAGDSVGFLAIETAVPWSITLQHRLRYPSRYMGFWMINAVVSNESRRTPDPRLINLGKRVVADTVEDFTCTPPRRIIVARPRPGERGFDILRFFLRDPRFAALLSHYKVLSRTSIETYELVSALPRPSGPCRAGI
jgi:hypothetical protein